jgi:hypothetical protein
VVLLCGLTACATAKQQRAGVDGRNEVADDYAAALERAKDDGALLFVDAWAPWCHSCVFLREHVLPSLQMRGYVFLSINTEKESNAAFLEKYPVDVWPTLFIVEPKSEKAVLKWLGTGTVDQLKKLLEDGELAASQAEGADPATLLAKADRLYGERKPVEAAEAYQAAFAALPKENPRRGRALESWLTTLYFAQKFEPCADAAVANVAGLPRGPSFANAASVGLSCAMESKRGVDVLEPLAVEALKLNGILADDRSGLYDSLVSLKADRNDDAGAKALAREWLTFLEGEAAKAGTPSARAVFDSHRVAAAVAAGEPLRAEAALKQSEKDLPDDYNPPARLAIIYREANRLDEATAALVRAFGKVYGPRKLRLFETRASILEKKHDTAGQRAALNEAVAYWHALPSSQRKQKDLDHLEEALKQLR